MLVIVTGMHTQLKLIKKMSLHAGTKTCKVNCQLNRRAYTAQPLRAAESFEFLFSICLDGFLFLFVLFFFYPGLYPSTYVVLNFSNDICSHLAIYADDITIFFCINGNSVWIYCCPNIFCPIFFPNGPN